MIFSIGRERLLMDLEMPHGRRGIEIAAAIRGRWPPIEIILTAAWFAKQALMLPTRAEFFAKPVVHEHIVRGMRRMAAAVGRELSPNSVGIGSHRG